MLVSYLLNVIVSGLFFCIYVCLIPFLRDLCFPLRFLEHLLKRLVNHELNNLQKVRESFAASVCFVRCPSGDACS